MNAFQRALKKAQAESGLSDSELKLASGVIAAFAKPENQGRKGMKTAKEIAHSLNNWKECPADIRGKITDATVRALIHYIRKNGLVPMLLAGPSGYWTAETPEEAYKYSQRLLGRIAKQAVVYRALKLQYHTAANTPGLYEDELKDAELYEL